MLGPEFSETIDGAWWRSIISYVWFGSVGRDIEETCYLSNLLDVLGS